MNAAVQTRGEARSYVQGWTASVLFHGLAVAGAVSLLSDLRLVPKPEPFRWDVALVEAPRPKPVEQPAPPQPKPAPAKPVPVKQMPVETQPVEPQTVVRTVRTVETVKPVIRETAAQEAREVAPVVRETVPVTTAVAQVTQTPSQSASPTMLAEAAPALAVRDGHVYITWARTHPKASPEQPFASELRLSRSTDGGQTFSEPVIVGHDRWVFPGCPHRPASLGVDGLGRLYVVWYTEGADETPAVYLAYSDDQGRTFSSKRALNVSKGTFPDHPQMAVDGQGRVVVIWEEQSPVRREVVMSYSLDRGQTFSKPIKLNEKKGQSPVVSVNRQGLVALAWLEHAMPGHTTILQTLQLPSTERR